MSWLFACGGRSTGASVSASVLPMNTQGCFPLGLIVLISLLSRGLSRVFSSTTVQKHQFFLCSAFFIVPLSHPYVTTGKTITLIIQTFVGKVISLLFNTLSRFVIVFFPRSKRLLSKHPGPQHWHIFYFSRWCQIIFRSVCTNLLSKSESEFWLLHIYASIWYRTLNFYQCKVRNMK